MWARYLSALMATTIAPDARAILALSSGATDDVSLVAELGSTGMLRVKPEQFFARSLASTWMVTAAPGSDEFDVEWRFVDFALCRVCDLRGLLAAIGDAKLFRPRSR